MDLSTKPSIPKGSNISTGADMKIITGWGTGSEAAMIRWKNVTRAEVMEMEQAGLTINSVEAWRDFYVDTAARYQRIGFKGDVETPVYRALYMEEILRKWPKN